MVEREPVSQAAQSVDLTLLSVVVVNFNGMDSLPATLESLSRQLPDMSAVIVSDDGSTDESREWVSRHYPACRVVGPPCHSGRPTVVRNAGLREVTTPYAFLTDNDIEFPAGSISGLLHAVVADDLILCATPRLLNGLDARYLYGDGNQLHFLCLSGEGSRGQRVEDRPPGQPFPTFAGGIMMIRMSHARAIGLFDEGYLHGWADDSEFQIRGRLAGFRSLHVPAVWMLHDDVQHGTERALAQFVNRYRLLFTVYSRRSLLLLSPSLLFFEIVALFGASLKSMAGLRLRAMADTIRGWPELLQQRRRCQRTRRVRDGQLLVGGPFQLPAAVAGDPLVSWAQRVLRRAFDLNWRLVRRWL